MVGRLSGSFALTPGQGFEAFAFCIPDRIDIAIPFYKSLLLTILSPLAQFVLFLHQLLSVNFHFLVDWLCIHELLVNS